MGYDKTQRIINSMKAQPKMQTPIATDMFLPNHSGDHSAGIVNRTPTADTDIANKAYVDSHPTQTLTSAGSEFYNPASNTSAGTLKFITPTQVYNANPGTGTITVDCSAIIPDGTKAVLVHVLTIDSTAATSTSFYSDSAATVRWFVNTNPDIGFSTQNQIIIGVDAAKKFYFVPSAASVSTVTLVVLGYWI